jgi:hypothetical protein
MLTYWKIATKPFIFRTFTGLTIEAFQKLLPAFEQAYLVSLEEQDTKRKTLRQRQPGGGRHARLHNNADKLVFILFYYKFYPTQIVQGFFFGVSQPQANEWIHRLTPVLNMALGYEKQLPARKATDAEAILAACPGLEFIIDGSERQIARPKDKERQKSFYSGKKRRHTIKNTFISNKRTKKIKVLGKTVPGKKHDKKLADEEDWRFPSGSHVWKDTGYQGYEPDNTITHQPKKKPRSGELTAEEKEKNKAISKDRIGVEHSIGGAKVYRIVRDIFRNRKTDFEDSVMEIACGLHNLRIDFPVKA